MNEDKAKGVGDWFKWLADMNGYIFSTFGMSVFALLGIIYSYSVDEKFRHITIPILATLLGGCLASIAFSIYIGRLKAINTGGNYISPKESEKWKEFLKANTRQCPFCKCEIAVNGVTYGQHYLRIPINDAITNRPVEGEYVRAFPVFCNACSYMMTFNESMRAMDQKFTFSIIRGANK